jgi:hypothetical protein
MRIGLEHRLDLFEKKAPELAWGVEEELRGHRFPLLTVVFRRLSI